MTTPSALHSSRRNFLVASTVGFAGLQFGMPQLSAASESVAAGNARAKSTILFFLCGGSSHIDMWDLKPDAPLEIRGEYNPIATSAPRADLRTHAADGAAAHHFSIVARSTGGVNTNDHHAGYYYNLTGHAADPSFVTLGNNRTPMADDWPYMGAVVGSRVPVARAACLRRFAPVHAKPTTVHASRTICGAIGRRT